MEQVSYTEDGHIYTDRASFIYGLLCPLKNEVRYIGASVNPVARYRAHLVPSEVRRTGVGGNISAKAAWILRLAEEGVKPKLVILEEVAGHCETVGKQHPLVKEAEERWIVKLVRGGHKLTNSQMPAELENDDKIFQEALERGRELF